MQIEDLYCLKAVDNNFVQKLCTEQNIDAFIALQLGQCIRTNL